MQCLHTDFAAHNDAVYQPYVLFLNMGDTHRKAAKPALYRRCQLNTPAYPQYFPVVIDQRLYILVV